MNDERDTAGGSDAEAPVFVVDPAGNVEIPPHGGEERDPRDPDVDEDTVLIDPVEPEEG